jgi:hypothetical protein
LSLSAYKSPIIEASEECWVEDEHNAKLQERLDELDDLAKKIDLKKSQKSDEAKADQDSGELKLGTPTFAHGRYPRRNRVPRLRHWLNERMVYDLTGTLLCTVKYDDYLLSLSKVKPRKRPNPCLLDEISGSLISASEKDKLELRKIHSTL